MNFTDTGNSDFASHTPWYTLTKCKMEHFDRVRDKIPEEELKKYIDNFPSYCFDFDDTVFFQNPYKQVNSTFLNLHVLMCNETERKCADDYKSIVTEAYVQFYYVNSYIDSLDFSQPVKYYYDMINTQITNSFLKRNFIYRYQVRKIFQ